MRLFIFARTPSSHSLQAPSSKTLSMAANYVPGYRYTPKENEFMDQLRRKLAGLPSILPADAILELNLYEFHPQQLWELYNKNKHTDDECCHFFSRSRSVDEYGEKIENREAVNGYWKCTGADSSVMDVADETLLVGYKKPFTFYERTSPTTFDHQKTNWMMQEFRASAPPPPPPPSPPPPPPDDDDTGLELVACRVFKIGFEGQTEPYDKKSDTEDEFTEPYDEDADPPLVSESNSSQKSSSSSGDLQTEECKYEEGGPSRKRKRIQDPISK